MNVFPLPDLIFHSVFFIQIKVSGSAKYKALLASFRLECHEVLKDVQPYPDNPKIGFGYNKVKQFMLYMLNNKL